MAPDRANALVKRGAQFQTQPVDRGRLLGGE